MAPLQIQSRSDLAAAGIGWRHIARMLATGELVQLRPGRFVHIVEWKAASIEERQRARARAHLAEARAPRVASHTTAAALHRLPVVRADDLVHVTALSTRGAARKGLVRHRGPVADGEVEEIDGMPVTTLARTLADLARTASVEVALCAADAALHRSGTDAESLRDEAIMIASRAPYGARRAREILEFADPRSESPGEVISRLLLVRIGFRVRTQRLVPAPGGGNFSIDFEVDDDFGEFDGHEKYKNPVFLNGRTPQQALLEEKQREDWIRGTTQRRLARWEWPHLTTELLSQRLASFGIHPASSQGVFLSLGREIPAPR